MQILEEQKKYGKAGGWLIFFVFSLYIHLIHNISDIVENYSLMNSDDYQLLTDKSSEYYSSFWQFSVWADMFMELVSVILILITGYYCMKRSVRFKSFSILFISSTLLFQIVELVLKLIINKSYTQPIFAGSELYMGVNSALVYAAIWIPYFMRSKRVKYTYVSDYRNSRNIYTGESSDQPG